MPVAEINDVALAYDDFQAGAEVETGAGDVPIVLLHAGICDRRMWDGCLEPLTAHHRVIRYDLRSFGQSTMPPTDYSHANDLLGLLDWLNVGQSVLVGVSMGGRIAIDFTLEHPERVAALVPVASAVGGYQQWSQEMEDADAAIDEAIKAGDLETANELELRLWVDGPQRSPTDVDPGFRAMARDLNAGVLARAEERDQGTGTWLDPPALTRLGDIRVPTLVVLGDADVEDVLTIGEQLTKDIPGSRKAVMTDVAHLPPLERPDLFAQLLLDFLPTIR
jgi:pimeloyl-ACP methyl ester carboxylesterase